MEIKEMQMSDIEQRSAEIEELLKSDDADIESLTKEVEEMEQRKAQILAEVEQRKKEMADAMKNAKEVEPMVQERENMDIKEVRNSKEYIEAFANYIKTGKDTECRALLTENATNGTVPVPEFVYDIVKTAWDREGIMSRVRKSYLKGNLKVGFEISGDEAVLHTEGGEAIDPENLVLGVVTLVPQSIKKLLQISDEVYDMRGEDFLRYVYEELAYRIAKAEADGIVEIISAAPTASTSTAPGQPTIAVSAISQSTIAEALGQLSDEAENPVIIMNKQTWSAFKAVQYAGNYATDIFENLTVLFNNSLPTFANANADDVFAIVGDLGYGAHANYPAGDDIQFKFDDMTLKAADLIEVLGRRYVALGVVAPNAFVRLAKDE